MPHTFTNRTRKFANLLYLPEQLGIQFRWERVNAFLYELGGILFVAASVLFLPEFNDYHKWGLDLIIAAASLFMIVSLHDLLEFITLGKDIRRADFVALALYLLGSYCLIHGSVSINPDSKDERSGYVIYACGSISYIIGSVLNSLLIFESPTRRTAQYFLLTAICFIIGSTMFLVGSTAHFVLRYFDQRDSYIVNTFLASFYIAGSAMFCLGGVFNIFRFNIVMRRDVREHEKSHHNPLVALLLGENRHSNNHDSSSGGGTNKTASTDYGAVDDKDEEVSYSKDNREDVTFQFSQNGD